MNYIRNTTLFLIGVAIILLGSFVIIFDYPQIQFFEEMEPESFYLLDQETKNIFERLVIELYVAVGIVSLGLFTLVVSVFKIYRIAIFVPANPPSTGIRGEISNFRFQL